MLLSLFSYCFVNGKISCEIFKSTLDKIKAFKEVIVYDENMTSEDNFEPFAKWLLASAAKYAAGDNKATLAKLHRNMQSITPKEAGEFRSAKVDTLAAAALIELLCLVKHTIFLVKLDLYDHTSSNIVAFNEFFQERERI